MKSIDTLVEDIYKAIDKGIELNDKAKADLGERLVDAVLKGLGPPQPNNVLRMSNFGTKCDRKLWYKVNSEDYREPLRPQDKFKFAYGHILEAVVLFLAEYTGHTVEAAQDEVEVEGVKGHPDGIIDGVLVDVKSANSRGFSKFKFHELEKDDPFGYLDQLSLYMEAMKDDERLKVKGEFAFLAIDKELGNIVLDKYKVDRRRDKTQEVRDKLDMVAQAAPPPRRYGPVKDGASGNLALDTQCKYCEHKWECFPGLRQFIYSNGPKYLVKVNRVPDVPEIKRR